MCCKSLLAKGLRLGVFLSEAVCWALLRLSIGQPGGDTMSALGEERDVAGVAYEPAPGQAAGGTGESLVRCHE